MVKYHSDRKETHCSHIGYSFRLAARVLLYAPSHRQDSTYHSLCYTSRGALAGMWNSSMGPPQEGLIRRPIAPWVNALTTELHFAQVRYRCLCLFRHHFRSQYLYPVPLKKLDVIFSNIIGMPENVLEIKMYYF